MREPSTTNRKWNSFFGVSISTPHSLSLKVCLYCFNLIVAYMTELKFCCSSMGSFQSLNEPSSSTVWTTVFSKLIFIWTKRVINSYNINCKCTDLSFIRDLFIIIEKRAAILTEDWLAYVFYCFWLTFLLVFIISFKIGRIRIFDNVIILRKLKNDIKFINNTLLSSTSGTLLSTSSTSNDFVMVWPRFLYTEV